MALTSEPLTDEVVEGVRAADPRALEAVYVALSGPLLNWLHSQTGDRDRAADLTDETFLELVRDCRSIEGGLQSLRAWLFRAARRNLIDDARRLSRRPRVVANRAPETVDGDPLPDERAAASDTAARVRRLVAALPPDQREVVTMRYLADLSTKEVALATDRSEVAVRALAFRGTRALAKRLGGSVAVAADELGVGA
ncbi:MAG: RNA polymerase sigma factor [Actinobacteria bacterium]|nr:RNA polymerase sigma factor [Actinomycetota bacterium]